MRRLLILTTVAVLTASAGGCFHWFNRGSSCGNTGSTYSADPCLQAPSVSVPADGQILPGPTYSN
jgi:hypothetical protein